MRAQGRGKIVNVSSLGGRFTSRAAACTTRASTPEAVAERIEDALTARRTRARYTVTPSARVLLTLRSLLPDAGWDRTLRSSFPSPGKH